MKMLKMQPKINTERPRLLSGAAIDRHNTIETTLPPIPEVVQQQPLETNLGDIYRDSNTEIHKKPKRLNYSNELM